MLLGQRQGLRRKLDGSQLAEISLNHRTKVGCVGDVQSLVAELNDVTVMIGAKDKLDFCAPIQNLGVRVPSG